MIYLLFDNPGDKNRMSFIRQLTTMVMKEIYSPKGKRLIAGWLHGCRSVLSQSHSGDVIVCWYDFQAVLCYWFAKLSFRQRKVVCINLLLKDKSSTKNKIVAWLYKKALKSKHFEASVTSVEYGIHLKERLGINKELFLLHDVFQDDYKVNAYLDICPNTVFCGGRNGRDWRFMLEVAKVMPDIQFHLVMSKVTYDEYHDELPSNVVARYNISMEDFMKEMCSCEIVALPLDTEAPAGLIVLFQAAANMKYIITTDTMTTREYLSDGRGCLLPNDVDVWKKAINEKLGNVKSNIIASEKLLNFLESECSERKFVEGVETMINKLE